MAKIMMIDDDEDFTTTVKTVLTKSGHEVEIVLDAKQAEAALEKSLPDLAIVDVMFPEDSSAGFDLARAIRANANLKNMPILILTAVNSKYPFQFGPHDIDDEWLPISKFVEKPVDLEVLCSKVEELLAAPSEGAA